MHDVDPLINSLYQAFDLLGVVLNGIIGGTLAPVSYTHLTLPTICSV